MPDLRGRRKALIPAAILLLCTALGAWLLIREPAAKRCARVAQADTRHRVSTASAEVGPTNNLAVPAAPSPAETAWYNTHCSNGKPR